MENSSAPKHWIVAGSKPDDYEFGKDQSLCIHKRKCAYVKSLKEQANGFATLMQTFAANSYNAQRIQLSACIKAHDVQDWAGIWMRVDDVFGNTLAFDNMQDRPITGSSDWEQPKIVLDVPENGHSISFGALINGIGLIWFTDFQIITVGKDIETSAISEKIPQEPRNMGFDE